MRQSDPQQLDVIDEQAVAAYLKHNPDFFSRHTELMDQLAIPHQESGALSLLEFRQQMQRQKIQQLQQDIQQLMQIARQNERIFHALSEIFELSLQATQLDDVTLLFEQILRDRLGLSHVSIRSFHCEQVVSCLTKERFQEMFCHRLQPKRFYLGRITKAEQNLLFGENAEVGSVALALIGEQNHPMGVVAFASPEDEHFQPDMDTLFLESIVNLITLMMEKRK
ncbi:DUF484 family protein [Algicola sagamiensis]|uniref:DUF484 family protein n=1 Tax=Algicola sagamiensis TaxID=163869 RepID=UPI00037C15E8|nr:DUF484 family protein [Algicola sagamiensis]